MIKINSWRTNGSHKRSFVKFLFAPLHDFLNMAAEVLFLLPFKYGQHK